MQPELRTDVNTTLHAQRLLWTLSTSKTQPFIS